MVGCCSVSTANTLYMLVSHLLLPLWSNTTAPLAISRSMQRWTVGCDRPVAVASERSPCHRQPSSSANSHIVTKTSLSRPRILACATAALTYLKRLSVLLAAFFFFRRRACSLVRSVGLLMVVLFAVVLASA